MIKRSNFFILVTFVAAGFSLRTKERAPAVSEATGTLGVNVIKGCPFNNFGPCKEDDCMFFLSPGHAHKILSEYTGIHQAGASPSGKHRCAFWHVFVAAQDVLDLQHEASDFLLDKPELHPFADHPWQLLLHLISAVQQKLESLEKELKKS